LKNLLGRIEAITGPSIWPVPAGFVAGAGLLAVVIATQPPTDAAPSVFQNASSDVARSTLPPPVATSSATLELSTAVTNSKLAQAGRGDAGLLLPPRADAQDVTRRIEAGLPPANPAPVKKSKVSSRRLPAPEKEKAKRPRIALVIDDMGFDRKNSARAVRLPSEVTLAFLPYAPTVSAQVRHARLKGHPVIMHLPMEAPDHKGKPGYNVLAVNADERVLRKQLARMLGRFGGYIGVNNHMGSRFTRDRAKMDIVVSELKKRGLYFLDSRTSGSTVGYKAAAAAGIPYAIRDVFLDHEPAPAKIRQRLAETERVARATGQAVAIGHPRDATMDQLVPWVAGLKARGFDLVRLDTLLKRPLRNKLAQVQTRE
jgi:uncharacterized protein